MKVFIFIHFYNRIKPIGYKCNYKTLHLKKVEIFDNYLIKLKKEDDIDFDKIKEIFGLNENDFISLTNIFASEKIDNVALELELNLLIEKYLNKEKFLYMSEPMPEYLIEKPNQYFGNSGHPSPLLGVLLEDDKLFLLNYHLTTKNYNFEKLYYNVPLGRYIPKERIKYWEKNKTVEWEIYKSKGDIMRHNSTWYLGPDGTKSLNQLEFFYDNNQLKEQYISSILILSTMNNYNKLFKNKNIEIPADEIILEGRKKVLLDNKESCMTINPLETNNTLIYQEKKMSNFFPVRKDILVDPTTLMNSTERIDYVKTICQIRDMDLNGIPKVNINFDSKQNKDQKNINKVLQQSINDSKVDNDGSF